MDPARILGSRYVSLGDCTVASTSACPTAGEWHRLVHGELGQAEIDGLVDHLVACYSCRSNLERLKLGETLIKQCQKRAAEGNNSSRASVLLLLQQLRVPTTEVNPPTADGDVTTESHPNPTGNEEKWARLLQPPLEDGEIGWLSPYRVLKVLGTGGMGRVYLAEDKQLQRKVALKVMNPFLIDQLSSRERFLREARAAAALKDDHIVTIYQVGQIDNVPYLALELLEGESLEGRLSRDELLPFREVLRIGRQVAEGLAVAHAQGLIHRDIKPANLWLEKDSRPSSVAELDLSRPATFKRVKILDFGLARVGGGGQLTGTGQVIGTPRYMAPEQARGGAVDARSDLFSLGCVLYRMASGMEPFTGDSVMAVLTALAVEDPRPLHDLNPTLPAPFVHLVERLLQKKPENRPESAEKVAAALYALGDVETTSQERQRPEDVRTSALLQKITQPLPPGQGKVPVGKKTWPAWALPAAAGALLTLFAGLFLWPHGARVESNG